MSRRHRVAQVVVGILSSRVSGLVRTRVLAHFFGVSALGDVWTAALRGPNVVQNLLGEQALSAAFIPIYVRKLAGGDEREASRFAGAILSLLLVTLSLVALLGVLLARPIVAVLNFGLLQDAAAIELGSAEIDRYELAVRAVRVIFPMTCILVLSAWCLAILNSHERFFLSYFAPVFWNAAIIASVVWIGRSVGGAEDLLLAACGGALVGAVLQVAIQLPLVLRLVGRLRLSLSLRVDGVRETLRLFGPAVAGRSAAQLSGYVDLSIASFLAVGSMAALGWAQTLYLLPIALFGLSVAAVELPALSREVGEGRGSEEEIVERVRANFERVCFFTVATSVAYLLFGFLVVGGLYRSGRFGLAENWLVYLVLAGYTLGLLASTTSRLLQSVFFALQDTRTPARAAALRLVVAGVLGGASSLWLDRIELGAIIKSAGASALALGAVGLALGSAMSAWSELAFLQRRLAARIPSLRLPWRGVGVLLGAGLGAGLPGTLLWWSLADWPPLLAVGPVLAVFGIAYLALARAAGYREAEELWRRVSARFR